MAPYLIELGALTKTRGYAHCITHTHTSLMRRSVQFKMVSMRSEKPICAPSRLSEVSPALSPRSGWPGGDRRRKGNGLTIFLQPTRNAGHRQPD